MIGPLMFVIGFCMFVPWFIIFQSRRWPDGFGPMLLISVTFALLMPCGVILWIVGK